MAGDDAALTFVAKMDDQASRAAATLEKNLDQLGGPIAPITGEADLDVDPVVEALNRIADKLDGFVTEASKAGDDAGEEMSGGFGEGLERGLKTGVIVGAAAFAAKSFADAFANALEQETDVARLTGSLGLDPAISEKLGSVAGALYASAYGESFGEVSDAVGAVVSSIDGLSTRSSGAITDVTEDALNFASAFDVDVARSAQIAGQLIRTGLVDTAEEGFDLLIGASQKVPVAIREDLLDAVDEYGPFFAALGYSGEEAFALLTDAAGKGMYGIDKTGDALKEFGILATDVSSKDVVGLYETLGFGAQDMADKLLAGGDSAKTATAQIIDGILGIQDPAQRASAAITLFGTPLEDLGVSEIPAFLESLKVGGGGLDDFSQKSEELSDTLNGTAANAFEAQRREIEQMGTDALATLMPYLLSFLKWAQETPGFITAVAVALGIAAVAWAAVTLAASPWLALGIAIALVIAGIILLFQNLGPVGEWLGEKLAAVGAWIGETFTAIKEWVTGKIGEAVAWVKANWPLLLAILTGPIGLAVYWIAKHMEEIKATVSEKITAVITFFRELPGRILTAVGNLAGTLVSAGKDLVRGIWEGISGMGSWLITKLTGWATSVIPGPIKKALGIASPSKVGAGIGRWFGIGVGDGVEDSTDYVETHAENLADAVVKPLGNLDAAMGNLTPTVSVAGRSDVSTVVEIRHVITSPDGSVTTLTAQEIANLIAGDPTAAATTEKAVRGAVQRRDSRTLAATIA